ncbi:MAG: YihY/virulence factor BrkB family protein [Sphaerochaetaceae bacterium]|jgi:membrane protein|nr:YihY/virulence factor BrkB family protein [Sphaerochaetaceae bacterium]MDD3367209.1 YihY/virulence factor BrkB family protein [Sphaerochaetaceae bacterium]MDD4220010.1 YihY/virulence factor BrkB family protein [Sphaerochaetaceae bacterium]MDY0371052.1 YihY/virulence factor BrkB family protein [Sphaerochaetaceae bacterium]
MSKEKKGKKNISQRKKRSNFLGRSITFLEVWYGKFLKDRITLLASGIVYTTLISIVPFISFLVAFLSLFNVLQPFYTILAELFTSIFGEVAGNQLVEMIAQFSSNASGLGVIGLISFIITSMLLINKVWAVINQIYRTASTNMNIVRRSLGFLTILIVGAILLGAYISVKSLLSSWVARILGWQFFENIPLVLLRFLVPWMIGWLFLFLMILVAPNAKVSGVSAAIGGLVGTLGMYVVNYLFSTLISKALSYSVIYGSFATVFLFLLWVYMLWVVILAAVEVSYVHQYQPAKGTLVKPVSPAEQLANGINVMMVIGQKYRNKGGETKIRDITDRLLMNERQLFAVLDLLVHENFIIATNNTKTAYVPARPLEDLKVVKLVGALYGEVYLEQNLDTIGDSIASQINAKGIKTLGSLTVSNLVERV